MTTQKKTQSERLFYLEFLAIFIGRVSRKDLLDRFGISEAAATKDISLYNELAPKVLAYNINKKTYLFSSSENLCYNHNIEQSLYSLCGERAISLDSTHAKRLPSWVNLTIKSPLTLELVSGITRCMYQSLSMKVEYSSLSSGCSSKLLSPLSLLNDGTRWFVRCFDHHKKEFRNYNLERFISVDMDDTPSVSSANDDSWNNEVLVQLKAHPKAEHPESILRDYSTTKNDLIEVKLKVCTVGFFLRRWNVDCTDNSDGNPYLQQLALHNKTKLKSVGLTKWDLGE